MPKVGMFLLNVECLFLYLYEKRKEGKLRKTGCFQLREVKNVPLVGYLLYFYYYLFYRPHKSCLSANPLIHKRND